MSLLVAMGASALTEPAAIAATAHHAPAPNHRHARPAAHVRAAKAKPRPHPAVHVRVTKAKPARPVRRPVSEPRQQPRVVRVDAGVLALDFALAQLGKPYVWGGVGPDSYDCSGLTQRAWASAGVDIPRTTYEQADTGRAVSLKDIQLGDLVIFYADASHVGIYAGHGNVVVAPHSGTVITIQQMKWMPIYDIRRPD